MWGQQRRRRWAVGRTTGCWRVGLRSPDGAEVADGKEATSDTVCGRRSHHDDSIVYFGKSPAGYFPRSRRTAVSRRRRRRPEGAHSRNKTRRSRRAAAVADSTATLDGRSHRRHRRGSRGSWPDPLSAACPVGAKKKPKPAKQNTTRNRGRNEEWERNGAAGKKCEPSAAANSVLGRALVAADRLVLFRAAPSLFLVDAFPRGETGPALGGTFCFFFHGDSRSSVDRTAVDRFDGRVTTPPPTMTAQSAQAVAMTKRRDGELESGVPSPAQSGSALFLGESVFRCYSSSSSNSSNNNSNNKWPRQWAVNLHALRSVP